MPRFDSIRSIKSIVMIFSLLAILNACNFNTEEDNDNLSTSVARTIEANALLQYTFQAQQALLTALAQTMAAPQQPMQTQPPQQPHPQVPSPPQGPYEATARAVSSILTTSGLLLTSCSC